MEPAGEAGIELKEEFQRATMFLSCSQGPRALALVAQDMRAGKFRTFAVLILTVVLFVGIATFMRLVAINLRTGWVVA